MYDCRLETYRNHTAIACIKHWRHRGSSDASSSLYEHASRDSPFVRCYTDVDYEWLLGPIIVAHRAPEGKVFQINLPEVVGTSHPHDQLYFISSWAHLAKEADLEYRIRSGVLCRYMSSGHNAELIYMPPQCNRRIKSGF